MYHINNEVIQLHIRHIFGKNLKYYRFQKNYTQAKLAEKIGISSTYLSELERGMHSLDFDKMELLCKHLEIEPHQLFLDIQKQDLPRRIDMKN